MEQRGKRRKMMGVVVSDKMDKTRVVAVDTWKVHPLYGKRMKSTKRCRPMTKKTLHLLGIKCLLLRLGPCPSIRDGQ